MEAADDEFILHGYDRCTIRAVASRAGTSLASLSRNWSSKRDLFEEVFRRHFDPVHMAQNKAFDRLEERGAFDARDIATAFFSSAMAKSGGDGDTQKSHQVYCLALIDPSHEARGIARLLVTPVRRRVTELFRRVLPGIDEQRFFLAMNVVFGVYIYAQTQAGRLAGAMGVDLATIDWANASEILADLVSHGIAANPGGERPGGG